MAAERIDPRTAYEMQRAADVVIDVRSPDEFAHEHIAGALNIPIDQLDSAELPPGQLIAACSMGGRAARAADLLDSAGRAAFVIDGGTKAWIAARLPVERAVPRRS